MYNSYSTKELKNKLNNIVCIAVCSLIMYSNYFIMYITGTIWFHY